MKATLKVLSLSLIIAGASMAQAAVRAPAPADRTEKVCDGFVPTNTLNIPVGSKDAGGITEQQFNAVIDQISAIYAPEIAATGNTLQVDRGWTDGTVNAYALRNGKTYVVKMFGGLARHTRITEDGFRLVLCHELGHHLGGAPKTTRFWWWTTWATDEGGADYFSTLKCLRRVFQNDDNAAIMAAKPASDFVVKNCATQFNNYQDQLVCQRMAAASTSVTMLFKDLSRMTKTPDFSTPDPSQVYWTNHAHPAAQCRMDTYLAGALCPVSFSETVSETDPKVGSCYTPRDTVGARPLCWFKPAK